MIGQIDDEYKKYKARSFFRLISYFLFEGRPLTTKGRWINPFLSFFYSLIIKIPVSKEIHVAFIVGTGRSGSTILGKALSICPNVGFLNEPKLFWAKINKNDDINGNYGIGKSAYRLEVPQNLELFTKRIKRFYSIYSYLTNSKLVVDKYPEMLFRYDYLNATIDRPTFLFLVRDGLSSVESINSWSKKNGQQINGTQEDWWGLNDKKWLLICDELVARDKVLSKDYKAIRSFECHKDRAAVEWILTMKEGLRIKQLNPTNFLFIRYETFCTDEDYRLGLLKTLNVTNFRNFNNYCSAALKPEIYSDKSIVSLSKIIIEEFNRVQDELGYKRMAIAKSES